MTHHQQPAKSLQLSAAFCRGLRGMASLLHAYPQLRKQEEALLALAEEDSKPFQLSLFGSVSAGKSSLINALIGEKLAIIGADETTATINHFSYADKYDSERLNSFIAHWKDGSREVFSSLEKLQSMWSGDSPEVLRNIQNVRHLEFFASYEALRHIRIIDTPGLGSTIAQHEAETQHHLTSFEPDAILYIFSPVGKTIDEEALHKFKSTCLDHSSPYNIIGVLHKWDRIYWEQDSGADTLLSMLQDLRHSMQDKVVEVLPVSAPLAYAAKKAPLSFWQSCLLLLSEFADEDSLKHALGFARRWDKTPARKEMREAAKAHELPWASFRSMLLFLFRHRREALSPEKAQALVRDFSGIDSLHKLLDEYILAHRAVIRLRQKLAQAQALLDSCDQYFAEALYEAGEDAAFMQRLSSSAAAAEADLHSWLVRKIHAQQELQERLRRHKLELSQMRVDLEYWFRPIDDVFTLVCWLDNARNLRLDQEDIRMLKRILRGDLSGVRYRRDDLRSNLQTLSRFSLGTNRENAKKMDKYLEQLVLPSALEDLPAETAAHICLLTQARQLSPEEQEGLAEQLAAPESGKDEQVLCRFMLRMKSILKSPQSELHAPAAALLRLIKDCI